MAVVSQERKADQKVADKACMSAIKKVENLKAYLGARFSLKNGMFPHELKF